MDITRENKNTKQAREIQKMVTQLIQLWIPTLEDELHGQKSKLRSQAMKRMGLWIVKLENENAEEHLRYLNSEWENENEILNKEYGEEDFGYEFKWEHI